MWPGRQRRTAIDGSCWPATRQHIHSPSVDRASTSVWQDALNLGWKLAQVVKATSPESLLDTYHTERHPIAAACCATPWPKPRSSVPNPRTEVARDTVAEAVEHDEPRRQFPARMSGLGVHYDLGEGHPLLGRRMPVSTWFTASGPLRVFSLLHNGRPVLLTWVNPAASTIRAWADRVSADRRQLRWYLELSGDPLRSRPPPPS